MQDDFSGDSTRDYRRSHLAKGADYDQALETAAFDAYMARIEREMLMRIVPQLFPGRIPRYLDFACGTGRIAQTLAPMADFSIGVDISASMVAQARQKCPEMEFVVCDPTAERLAVEPVHLLTAFRFFGNAQQELRRAALRTMHDLLLPHGYLIVNNHRNPWSVHNLLLRAQGGTDGSDLTPGRLKHLLSEAGFRLIRIYGIGFWVVRHALRRPETLSSAWARRLESLSAVPGLGNFCPDMLVVAERM